MELPTFCVMLSTYNSSRFLREQIDSILNQEQVDLLLLIRDDGSTDNTLSILSGYDDPRIIVAAGPNLGYAESFMEALFSAPRDRDFYAFSDHDDVWEPQKLIAAARALRPLGSRPALYASRMKVVDERLNFICMSKPIASILGFGNSLIQGSIGGATSVLNRPMFDILRHQRPRMYAGHDNWLYMVASALGEIVFSEESWILYRQHSRNTLGAGLSSKVRWRERFGRLKFRDDPQRLQACEFDRIFGDRLDDTRREQLARFAHHDRSLGTRLNFLVNPSVDFSSIRSRVYYSLRVALFRT